MTFSQKFINVQFTLANGSFGKGKDNTATVSGYRVTAQILNAGGLTQSTCSLAIYGLPLDLMNQLSTVGNQANKIYKNSITVEAQEEGQQATMVFAGDIVTAWVDANAMPQVCFRVMAAPGRFYAMKPATPLSIQGGADASGLLSNIASQMGMSFENAGVKVRLSNPYFGGTLWTQALAIAKHGGFDLGIDRNTMVIVPPGKTREGSYLISPDTGMVGYPTFNQAYVIVTALFDPALKYLGEVEIKSDLTAACGKWQVSRLEYQLESLVPGGKWFMTLNGTYIGPTVA